PSRRSGTAGRARPGTVVPGGMTSAAGTDVRVVMPATIPSRMGHPTRSAPDCCRPHRTTPRPVSSSTVNRVAAGRHRSNGCWRPYHPGPPETVARQNHAWRSRGGNPEMNVSFSTAFAFVVGTMAAGILVAMVWPALGRVRRERHFAMVDVLLASSYIG